MKPTRDDVRSKVLDFIGKQTAKGHESGLTLGDRGLDSLDTVELVIDAEDEWGVEISDELWGHDTTVEKVVSDVQRAVCGDVP